MRAIRNILLFGIYGFIALVCIIAAIAGRPEGLFFTLIFVITCICIFVNGEKRRSTLVKEIEANLTLEETLIAEAVELRPFALFHRRFCIAVTNNRIISLQRKILGGYKQMEEWQWRYIAEVKIDKNIFPGLLGSNLMFTFMESPNRDSGFTIRGVESATASKIYALANAQKQDWVEKHRIRRMEESRAAAGGFQVQPYAPAPSQQPSAGGIEQRLIEAKSLLDKGIISDVDYQAMKTRILSGISNF
jgi:hypothetical protein